MKGGWPVSAHANVAIGSSVGWRNLGTAAAVDGRTGNLRRPAPPYRGLFERFRRSLRSARRDPGECISLSHTPNGRRGPVSTGPRRPSLPSIVRPARAGRMSRRRTLVS